MKAMIFAAGLGTRLKPITDTLPKALVPVSGKPLLEHVMRKIADVKGEDGSQLFDGVVVNVHHFAEKIVTWLAENNDILPSSVSDESALLLETGGAVHHARALLDGCGSFLIHNVDIFTSADLGWFASQHRPDALSTLLVSERKTSRYLLFQPEDMRLVGWKNNVTGEYIMTDSSVAIEDCLVYAFSGIHIMSDKIFDMMDLYIEEKGLPADEEIGTRFPIVDFYLWASSRLPIYGVVAENLDFLDVGKLDILDQAEKAFNSHGHCV